MLDQSVTIKAETVEKAIRMGLLKLNITQEEANINVISEGKKGLFGFGKQDAIVEVSAKTQISLADLTEQLEQVQAAGEVETEIVEEATDEFDVEEDVLLEDEEDVSTTEEAITDTISLEAVANYLEDVIRAYGAESKVTVTAKSRQVIFNLETEKSGLIIGKHGKTIDALQTLAQVMVHNHNNRRTMVLINVGDYRDRRASVLERIAKRTATQVLRTKQSVILEPLWLCRSFLS